MSHLRTCSLNISNANESILTKAIELIAKEEAKGICHAVRAMSGENVSVLAGVANLNGEYGYGVVVATGGKISVVGDDWGASLKLDAFEKRVTAAYNVVAYQVSMHRQGFQTTVVRQGAKYQLVGQKA